MTAHAAKSRPDDVDIAFHDALKRLPRWQDTLAVDQLPLLKGYGLRRGGVSSLLSFCISSWRTAEENREGECIYSHHTIPTTLSYRFLFRDHLFLTLWTSFMNSTVLMRPKSLIHVPS